MRDYSGGSAFRFRSGKQNSTLQNPSGEGPPIFQDRKRIAVSGTCVVSLMPLESGTVRHHDLAGIWTFHRGLLRKGTPSRMRVESEILLER